MDSQTAPRNVVLIVALIQGLALFALTNAFEHELWPTDRPVWYLPLWSIALLLPVFVQLSVTRANGVRLAIAAACLLATLALVGAYTGSQMIVSDTGSRSSTIGLAYSFSMAVAVFKALIYAQRRWLGIGEPGNYASLFLLSWRNFLLGSLAALFVLGVWLTLLLWAGLFDVIGVSFFRDLFRETWFIIPVLSVAFGLGVLIFRNLDRVIDSITRLLEGLFRLLLPLIIVVAVLFVATLPFVGLQPLWNTGSGTFLLMSLLAGLLFSLNAVYQDGAGGVYPQPIHWAVCIGVVVLPVIAGLAGYGLWLRIDQYGLTVERCWALLIWSFLALFSAGYLWGVVRHRLQWVQTLARTNTLLGVTLAILLTLTNTPLLDFRKLTLASQLARVESGNIAWSEFDACYVHDHLGQPGETLLEAQYAAGTLDRETVSNRDCRGVRVSTAEFWENTRVYPPDAAVPDALKALLAEGVQYEKAQAYALIQIPLQESADEPDFVLLEIYDGWVNARRFARSADDEWVEHSMQGATPEDSAEALLEALEAGDFQAQQRPIRDLVVGGVRFRTH